MKGYPLPSQPPGPHREGKGLPTLWRTSSNCRWRVPSTWLSSGGGCGAGGTQPHTALAPEAGVTLWQCHPKPMMVFSGQPRHPEPPRAAQPRGKAVFAHCWPLPRASDMSCLACISSMAISKLTARSCPGMQGPVCHWCHWCALAGKRRAESPQQHPRHGRRCAHGASPRATRGSRRDLRTCQGGCQAPMPSTDANHGTVTLYQEALPSLHFAQQARESSLALPGQGGGGWLPGLLPAMQCRDVPTQLTPHRERAPTEQSLPWSPREDVCSLGELLQTRLAANPLSFRVHHHGASPTPNPALLQPPVPWLLASPCTVGPDHVVFW